MQSGNNESINLAQFIHGDPVQIITRDGKEHVGQFIDKSKNEIYAVMQFAVLYQKARENPGQDFKNKKSVMLQLGNSFQSIDVSDIRSIQQITEDELVNVLQTTQKKEYDAKENKYQDDLNRIRSALSQEDIRNLADDLLLPIKTFFEKVLQELGEIYPYITERAIAEQALWKKFSAHLKNMQNLLILDIGNALTYEEGKFENYVKGGYGPTVHIPLSKYTQKFQETELHRFVDEETLRTKIIERYTKITDQLAIIYSHHKDEEGVLISIVPKAYPDICPPAQWTYFYVPLQEYRDIKSGKQQAPKKKSNNIQMSVTRFSMDLEKLQK